MVSKIKIVKMIADKTLDVRVVNSIKEHKDGSVMLFSDAGKTLDADKARSMLWDYKVIGYKPFHQFKYMKDELPGNFCTVRDSEQSGKPTLWFVSDSLAESYNRRVEAFKWIALGGLCMHRSGLAYRGARVYKIATEQALKDFPNYDFGMGFYELQWEQTSEGKALVFESHSLYDME